MAMRLIVSLVTALVMLLVGAFWMFTMLIGTNGFNESKGVTILAVNLVMVILSIIFASIMSGWLAHKLRTRSEMSVWLIAPFSVFLVTAAAFTTLFVGSIVVFIIVEETMR